MGLATTSPGSWLPESLWNTFLWGVSTVLYAFGSDSPVKQITASFALGIFAILTSWITLGATLLLAGVFAVTFTIGFARLVPVVNEGWVGLRDVIVP